MIVITGASQGIGLACARALLARTDTRVMITGRSRERLAAARATIPPAHRRRLVVRASDQASLPEVQALAAELTAASTPLDAVILGIGVNPREELGPRHLHTVPEQVAAATIATNCTHTLMLTAAILARFHRERRGALLWIGSQGYRVGITGSAIYGATKGFLSGLARAAQREYAARGVRVHLVHPGLVRTPRHAGWIDGFAARHGLTVEDAEAVAERIVDRLLDPTPGPAELDL